MERLQLKHGQKVLLIACGTGNSFEMIAEKVGKTGLIVGVDNSQKMLKIAENKIKKNGWENIKLINSNAELISQELIKKELGKNIEFDFIIAELALSVIPNWKTSIQKSIQLLADNGKIGVLDCFRTSDDWISRTLNYLANSDMSRNIPGYLQETTDNYWNKKLGKTGMVFIGIGEKRVP